MAKRFSATIYKVGINPCVEVPERITRGMTPTKGFIPVKGKISGFAFKQTLCPVKEKPFRLYINGPMLKGSATAVGDNVTILLEQDTDKKSRLVPDNKALMRRLAKEKVVDIFRTLPASRRKDINRYLNNLKSAEAVDRNISRIVDSLRKKTSAPLFRLNV